MPLGKGVRYRYKKGTNMRLAFKGNKVMEAKNMDTGATHTPAEFAADRRRKNLAKVTMALLLMLLPSLAWAQGAQGPWNRGLPISCSADAIAATLTELTGCVAPAAPMRYYIASVTAQSISATGGQFLLRSGTGTNCGTGTTSVLPSSATVIRLGAPANTAAPAVIILDPPIALTPGHALCVLGKATDSTTIQVTGWLAQ